MFVTVAHSRSISQAAARLYVSHSTVSRGLAALEAELGVKLVERDNHVVGLTEAGELLLPRAAQMLSLAEETERELHDFALSTKNN